MKHPRPRHFIPIVFAMLALIALSSCRGGSHAGLLPQTRSPGRHHALTTSDTYSTAILADGPTAYYRLDDSGTVAADSSGNGLNGSVGSSVTEAAAALLPSSADTAMTFPGLQTSAGVVKVPQSTMLQPSASVSTEFWLRFSNTPSTYAVALSYGSDSGSAPYDFWFNGGKIAAQFTLSSGTLQVYSPTALQPNTVYYIAATYDGTTARLYVNGSQVASATQTGTITGYSSGFGLAIGDDAGLSDPGFSGTIDEVAVYAGKVLGASQILNHYNAGTQGTPPTPTPTPLPTPTPTPTPSGGGTQYATTVLGDGPSAYYHLDDATSSALDSSANTLNGAVGSSVVENAAGLVPSMTDTAMAFPAVRTAGGIVKVPQTPILQPSSAVSMEAWIRFTSAPKSFTVALAYGSDSNSAPYALWFKGGKIAAQFTLSSGTLQVYSPSALQTNTTYHIVGTYDGSIGRLYINGAQAASAAQTGTFTGYAAGFGLAIGDDAALSDPPFGGTIDEVAVYAGKALSASQISNHYSAGTTGVVATPRPAPAYTDWSTLGDNLVRTNYNANETTLSAANVGGLALKWKVNLGSAITAQPLVATNVSIGGTPATVLYIGTEGGIFYALDANTGATLWSKALASIATGCLDLPGGTFGITGTATFDRSTNRVYVSDGHAQVHALDMATGAEAAGWPIIVTSQFAGNHIYSGLALNPANGLLYVTTGSFCDSGTWNGRIDAIDTASATIADTFFPATPYTGDGIWGLGGPAIDAANNVFVATGNTEGGPADNSAAGDALVQLTAALGSPAISSPGTPSFDSDFGATPMTYQPPGCAELVSAKRKDGHFYTWQAGSVASGPLQGIAIGAATSIGQFVGQTAYSPVSNLVYVGVPNGNSTFTHGLVALRPQTNCTLALAWQQTVGSPAGTSNDNDSVTIANGVAYLTDGIGNAVFAFDATTGTPLWNSGTTITGPALSPPTVDGRLFVSSWDHNLYAFGVF